jgi:hypothetical protein
MKRKFTTYFIAFIFVLGAGYHVYTVIDLKSKISVLKYKQNISLELQKDISVDDENFLKNFSMRTVSLLSEEQLIELAKMEWHYKLTINGEEFMGQPLKVEGNKLQIVLSEEREKRSMLSEELNRKGQIPDYFYKQFKVESEITPEITNKDEQYSTSIYYNFSYLSHGDKIKITLSDELSKRLNLKNMDYIIYIK